MTGASIEWFGCATFRVRIAATTLFFDTYLDKAPGVPDPGLRAAEVDEAASRPNLDGEPYQGSMVDFLVQQAELLGGPVVALCHHDPLLPPVAPAYDVVAAETALRNAFGDERDRTFAYREPVPLFSS